MSKTNPERHAPENTKESSGLRDFGAIVLSQVVSLLGSQLTMFGLGVWVFQETGSVTRFTHITIVALLPGLLFAPLAGVWVDRFDRRRLLLLSDSAAAVSTLVLLLLAITGRLEIWHVYPLVAFASLADTLQLPALSASITLLVPRRHLGRASGLQQLSHAGSRILAPLCAGWLLPVVGLDGLLWIDLATFAVSLVVLTCVTIPAPNRSAVGQRGSGSFLGEVAGAWTLLRGRPSLFRLLVYFALFNFLVAPTLTLVTPLVLSFSGPEELGWVLAISATGLLVGSVAMSFWGGPRRRILGVLSLVPASAFGLMAVGGGPWPTVIAGGLFLISVAIPIANGCSQALWQSKVESDIQGRVFALRQMLAQGSAPVVLFLLGFFVEGVLEPAMLPDGALSGVLGPWLGQGPGRGLGLLFLLMGVLLLPVWLWSWSDRRLLFLEDEVPDIDP